MLKNYLNVAFRNLTNNKVFSIINILGLSFGLACAILIGLWVHSELSKNQFHTKDIYQVIVNIKDENEPLIWVNSPSGVAQVLYDNVPGVEHAAKVASSSLAINNGEDKFNESGLFADSTFFKIFDYPLVKGQKDVVLKDMNVIVISEDLSLRIFGTTDVIGKTIEVKDLKLEDYQITGVYQLPKASTANFQFVIPYHKYRVGRSNLDNPGNFNDYTFVTLLPGVDKKNVEEQFSEAIYQKYKEQRDVRNQFHLYPYKDLYLKSDFSKWPITAGRIQYVRLFTIVGITILVIACINFMNLSTAQAARRAKEVGVRKTIGARKSTLLAQFLGESFLITAISLLLAITFADLLLPSFNLFIDSNLELPLLNPQFWLIMVGILLVTGLVAGSYPALYLSSFQAATVLKGESKKSKSMGGVRKFLVVFQFTLSITLIICTIIVYKQINYIQKKDLGISRENILMHWAPRMEENQYQTYKNELMQIPGIESISIGDFNPMMIYNSTSSVNWSGKNDEEDDFMFHVMTTDADFVNTFKVNLISGKDLPKEIAENDTMQYFLLNQKAVEMMRLDKPVGTQISVWGSTGIVTGVVEDFNHDNLYKAVEPVVLFLYPYNSRAFVKLSGSDPTETIAEIKSVYERYDNNYAFSYKFLDDEFNSFYKNVVTVGKLSNVFAGIAIFISCLGLFGLASYMAEQRKKETGIRKVMGASTVDLTFLFSRDFVKLVMISFILACPLAWYLADGWLADFAYRINPSAWIFLIAGGIALFIAVLTVSYHTIKTTLANPITSLRYE